jgi:uncharacterized protein DUF3574
VRATLAAALLLAGCASIADSCPGGAAPAVSDVLYFGTARPGGTVSAAEWSDFLRDEVTPRFPAGLTAWDAAGQWKSARGPIEREASHVVSIVHPSGARHDESVRAIAAAYKARFAQDAVLRVTTDACVSY